MGRSRSPLRSSRSSAPARPGTHRTKNQIIFCDPGGTLTLMIRSDGKLQAAAHRFQRLGDRLRCHPGSGEPVVAGDGHLQPAAPLHLPGHALRRLRRLHGNSCQCQHRAGLQPVERRLRLLPGQLWTRSGSSRIGGCSGERLGGSQPAPAANFWHFDEGAGTTALPTPLHRRGFTDPAGGSGLDDAGPDRRGVRPARTALPAGLTSRTASSRTGRLYVHCPDQADPQPRPDRVQHHTTRTSSAMPSAALWSSTSAPTASWWPSARTAKAGRPPYGNVTPFRRTSGRR